MDLEALEQLVALLFVDRSLFGDPHPFGTLERLHVENFLINRSRVVNDQDDLGLRIEVGARLNHQVLQFID